MSDRDKAIKREAAEVLPHVAPSERGTKSCLPASLASAWEDNPYRLRGIGWEGSFADTGWLPLIALAILVSPVAFVIGLLGGLFLRGSRARRKAWIMAAVATPGTAVWILVLVLKI